MEKNLYEYLHKKNNDPYIIELLQYEINKRIYDYGNNFMNPWEKMSSKTIGIKGKLKNLYRGLNSSTLKQNTNLVLSNSYFTIDDQILKDGYKVVTPWWNIKRNGFYIKDTNLSRIFSF